MVKPRGWFGEVRDRAGWWTRRFADEGEAAAWVDRRLALDPAALGSRVRPMPERTRCGPPSATPISIVRRDR